MDESQEQPPVEFPFSADDLPPDRSPCHVYLARLRTSSARGMRDALDTIAQLVRPTSSADAFPWHLLRYQHVATIRTRLIQHYPSPASANKALCALRGVLGEAFNLGLISGEDHARATSVRSVQGSRLPKGRAVTDREVSALFEACRTDSPIGIRDAALLGVLLGCGLRRSEVVALDLAHLDVTSGSLRVLGKGNKERMCYVTNEALVYLRRWLAVRGREAGPLFLPINKGGVVARRRLTDQAILVIVQRLARRARISELSPHDARRTFISNAIDASKDLVAVRDLAGHKSIITTASYDRRLEASKIRVAKLVRLPTPG